MTNADRFEPACRRARNNGHPARQVAASAVAIFGFLCMLGTSGCGSDQGSPQSSAPRSANESHEAIWTGIRKAAEQGNADAQFDLGRTYDHGEGVPKDAAKALEWWRKAADQGLAKAQYALGVVYQSGKGVTKDAAKAVEWYRKAAEQGYAAAQYALGRMYYYGEAVPKDAAKALEWWRRAADQGLAEAQYAVGVVYQSGSGVTKDAAKAVEWYRKAAEQGYAEAQFNLGRAYSNGEGVPKNAGKAVEWYGKAAEQGYAAAQNRLAWAYFTGSGTPKDAAKAAEWYRKAAEQGHARAQGMLGVAYSDGGGVPKDAVLAYVWANLSAASGGELERKLRDGLEPLLSRSELQEAQRLASQWKPGRSVVREARAPVAGKAAQSAPPVPTKQGTATAFLVSKAGDALTNFHVVNGCTDLRVEGRDGSAKVVTTDKVNDLALLRLPGETVTAAAFAKEPQKLRQGEDVVVFGYPLNFVLSSGGNLTPGVVSALTGLGNNTNQIQITAPIQPGSSGSPVLSKKGEVVGVVSMKLSDDGMARATGTLGQNVNFAVSGQTVRAFLATHRVEYRSGGFFAFEKSAADLADEARKWTVVLECWK